MNKKVCPKCDGYKKILSHPFSKELDRDFDKLLEFKNGLEASLILMKRYPNETIICPKCKGTGLVEE